MLAWAPHGLTSKVALLPVPGFIQAKVGEWHGMNIDLFVGGELG
jgi:hypothetical protein